MTAFLDTKAAADFLHEQVPGETEKYWLARLNNMRRTDRPQTFNLQFAKIEGKAGFYDQKDVAAYSEFEKLRRIGRTKLSGRAAQVMQAFGIGEPGGGSFGRKWVGARAHVVPSPDGGPVFVQFFIHEPMLAFAMSAEQASTLGKELVEMGRAAQRFNGDAPPLPAPEFEVVTDNDAMLVKRRVIRNA